MLAIFCPHGTPFPLIRLAAMTIALGGVLAPAPGMGQGSPSEIEERVAEQLPSSLALYRELLSLPNDAHYPSDIARLVSWLETSFESRGFTTQRLSTGSSPLLLAERRVVGAERTVLVYLQADGQPVDSTQWEQPDPYEAVLKERGPDGKWRAVSWDRVSPSMDRSLRIFARSASDSKGPIAQFLSAMDRLAEVGVEPTVNLKVIIDTEEELGSPRLPAAVERYRERLDADMLVIFDGPPHSSGAPTIAFGARGISTVTLVTYGPRVPQHSGHYGNFLPNPALEMAELLASLKDDDGRVTIPGWYEGIDLDSSTLRMLAEVPDREDSLLAAMGVGRRDSVASTLQEALQYPSLNVRGLSSGWVGSQTRTIIPATATAELDIRLVIESDPATLLELLRRHIQSRGYTILDREPTEEERVSGARIVTMTDRTLYAAFRTDFDSDLGKWLTAALRQQNGSDPIRIRTMGGSIPISPFVATLGIPAATVPTVNPDNNQHSPNENLRIAEFERGIITMVRVLTEPVP